jgi:hypothetical protein
LAVLSSLEAEQQLQLVQELPLARQVRSLLLPVQPEELLVLLVEQPWQEYLLLVESPSLPVE